jgi:hypothetical protein
LRNAAFDRHRRNAKAETLRASSYEEGFVPEIDLHRITAQGEKTGERHRIGSYNLPIFRLSIIGNFFPFWTWLQSRTIGQKN